MSNGNHIFLEWFILFLCVLLASILFVRSFQILDKKLNNIITFFMMFLMAVLILTIAIRIEITIFTNYD